MKNILPCFILLALLAACNEKPRVPEQPAFTSDTTIPLTTPEADTAALAPATPFPKTCLTRAPLFEPKQNSVTDASLKAYLKELEMAVRNQEAETLFNLLDPKIATGFDGSGGIEDFRKKWNPENKNSEVWPLLNQMLQLGGSHLKEDKTNKSYAIPYVFSAWPDTLDAFAFRAVINDGAMLREEPAINATPVCALERVILRVDYKKSYPEQENITEKEWWYVESPDGGLKGYVNRSDLYSPVGYRAIFNKNSKGRWLMTGLLAGD